MWGQCIDSVLLPRQQTALQVWPMSSLFILDVYAFNRKTVDLSRIQTLIFGVEGKHADHFTTTAQDVCSLVATVPLSYNNHEAIWQKDVHGTAAFSYFCRLFYS